jgi:hypothetical protein
MIKTLKREPPAEFDISRTGNNPAFSIPLEGRGFPLPAFKLEQRL